MKFLLKCSKQRYKILLAGLSIAQFFADVALYALAANQSSQYHLEASFKAADGFKMIIDKR
jgi:hypothetical protein